MYYYNQLIAAPHCLCCFNFVKILLFFLKISFLHFFAKLEAWIQYGLQLFPCLHALHLLLLINICTLFFSHVYVICNANCTLDLHEQGNFRNLHRLHSIQKWLYSIKASSDFSYWFVNCFTRFMWIMDAAEVE